MKYNTRLLVFMLFLISTVSFGQPGSLDGDFDADGIVLTGFDNVRVIGRSVAVQADGKIVVAGEYIVSTGFSDFALVRYNIDGSLDNTFGTGGRIITDFGNVDRARSVTLQSDGKIIVAGVSNAVTGINSFAMARYLMDGTLDNSFGTSGMVLGPFGEGRSIALQTDGKIVVAGSAASSPLDFAVVRYNSDGTIDATFGIDGVITTDFGGGTDQANSIAIQLDGKIVVAGTAENDEKDDFATARYTPNGSLDNSFSVDGKVTTTIGSNDDRANSIVIQPDGKIIVSGIRKAFHLNPSEFAIVRYNMNGTLDQSFNVDGKVTSNFVRGTSTGGSCAVLQSDGKIIVAGQASVGAEVYNFALLRYNTDGTLDDTFDSDGIVTTTIQSESKAYGCAIQPDGRIVVAGYASNNVVSKFAVARYISGSNLGVITFSKQDYGLLVYPNPLHESSVIEYTLTNDEKISIDLYDISGRMVQSFVREEKRDKGPHKETLVIDTSIPSGTYILTLSNGMGSTSVQLVK